MTPELTPSQRARDAALKHIGFESEGDLIYWSNADEISSYRRLVDSFARFEQSPQSVAVGEDAVELLQYVSHKDTCPVATGEGNPEECDCGLGNLIERIDIARLSRKPDAVGEEVAGHLLTALEEARDVLRQISTMRRKFGPIATKAQSCAWNISYALDHGGRESLSRKPDAVDDSVAGRVVVGPDDPLYKAFRPKPETIAAIEKNEAANAAGLTAIRDMMVGHVANWPEPKKFGTAIALVDKALHKAIALSRKPSEPVQKMHQLQPSEQPEAVKRVARAILRYRHVGIYKPHQVDELEHVSLTEAELEEARAALAAMPAPDAVERVASPAIVVGSLLRPASKSAPPGCHCTDTCGAPVIMGKQQPCRRPGGIPGQPAPQAPEPSHDG